jgi:hypothetical protein
MKKLVLTIAIVLGVAFGASAQQALFSNENNGGGLFQRGYVSSESFYNREGSALMTPGLPYHLQDDNQDAPLGSGIAMLLGMGAAYLVAKKRKED